MDTATAGGSKAVCIRMPRGEPGEMPKGTIVSVVQGQRGAVIPTSGPFSPGGFGRVIGVTTEDVEKDEEFCLVAISGVAPVRLYNTAEYGAMLRCIPYSGIPGFSYVAGAATAAPLPPIGTAWRDGIIGMCLQDATSDPSGPDDIRLVECLIRPQFVSGVE